MRGNYLQLSLSRICYCFTISLIYFQSTLAIAYFAGATATSSLMANIYPKRLTQILQAAAQDNTYFRKISDMQKSFNEMIATAESFLGKYDILIKLTIVVEEPMNNQDLHTYLVYALIVAGCVPRTLVSF